MKTQNTKRITFHQTLMLDQGQATAGVSGGILTLEVPPSISPFPCVTEG
jgi:hypothetical protein